MKSKAKSLNNRVSHDLLEPAMKFDHLLESGADPNAIETNGFSVVHIAAESRDGIFIDKVYQHGLDPKILEPNIVHEIDKTIELDFRRKDFSTFLLSRYWDLSDQDT